MRDKVVVLVLVLLLLSGCSERGEAPPPDQDITPVVITMETPETPDPAPPEPFQIEPVAEAVAAEPDDPAAAAVAQYLEQHPQLANMLDLSAVTPLKEADGRLVYPLRGECGGILPRALDSLVYDPGTGQVTERYAPWRGQGGYRLQMDDPVIYSLPITKLALTVPQAALDYLMLEPADRFDSVEAGDVEDRECCWFYSFQYDGTPMSGWVGEVYRHPRSVVGNWFFYDGYPDWFSGDFGARGSEFARDEDYVYFLARPTDVQFDTESPEACRQYKAEMIRSELIADSFVLENQLTLNPYAIEKGPDGYPAAKYWRLRALAHSFLIDDRDLYFTMLLPFEEETYTSVDPAWTLEFYAETADGTIEILEPDGGWIPDQRYHLDCSGFTGLRVAVLQDGQELYSMDLLPAEFTGKP